MLQDVSGDSWYLSPTMSHPVSHPLCPGGVLYTQKCEFSSGSWNLIWPHVVISAAPCWLALSHSLKSADTCHLLANSLLILMMHLVQLIELGLRMKSAVQLETNDSHRVFSGDYLHNIDFVFQRYNVRRLQYMTFITLWWFMRWVCVQLHTQTVSGCLNRQLSLDLNVCFK